MRALYVALSVLLLAGCASKGETREERMARIWDHMAVCWPHGDALIPNEQVPAVEQCVRDRERQYQLASRSYYGTDNPAVLQSHYNWPQSRSSATLYCVGC